MSPFKYAILCSVLVATGCADDSVPGVRDAGRDGATSFIDAGADASHEDASHEDAEIDAAGDDAGIAPGEDAGIADAGIAPGDDAGIDAGDAGLDFWPPAFEPTGALAGPDGAAEFGYSVAVSPDGSMLAVGDNNAGPSGYGAVYLFARTETGFATAPFQTLMGSTTRADFGASVAFMPDGGSLAVGDYSIGPGRPGTLDLFAFVGPLFATSPYQTIMPAFGGNFAISIAFSPDGRTLAVGASGTGATGVVYRYARASGYLFATTPAQTLLPRVDGAPQGRYFGTSVAFSPDGTRLLVGDDGHLATNGIVRVFAVTSEGFEPDVMTSLSGPPGATQNFGAAVAVSPDGRTLAVGDPYSRSETRGAVVLYPFPDGLTPFDTLTPQADGQRFGRGLAFTPDGETLVVGDRQYGASDSGAVLFFTR